MIRKSLFAFALVSLAAFAPACGAADSSDGGDVASETASNADSVASTSTFYSVRQDMRRCVWPACGGYWVTRVNQPSTRCADNKLHEEGCYVVDMDVENGLGLDAEEAAAFR